MAQNDLCDSGRGRYEANIEMPSAVRLWNSAPGARIEIGDRGTQVIMPFLSNVSLTNQGNQLPAKQD